MSIYPPIRTYAFNRSLAPNDGLLAFTISQSRHVSIDEAAKIIQRDVDAMNKQLQATGAMSLGRIGMLKYDRATQAIQFTPYPTDQLGVATAWLPVAKQINAPEAQEPEISVKRYSPLQRALRIAASIAVLICIWFMASTPITLDEAAFASLSPQIKQPEAAADTALPQIAIVAPQAEEAQEADPEEAAMPEPVAEAAPAITPEAAPEAAPEPEAAMLAEPEPEQPAASADNKYLVIVGSFASRSEAQKFIDQHPASRLEIFEKDSRIRVYAGAYPTETAAYKAIQDKSIGFDSAWVCKR